MKYRAVELEEGMWGIQQKVLLWWMSYSIVEWEPENNFHRAPIRIPVAFFSQDEAEEFANLLNTETND